jgi:hypothetical protein
MAKLGIRVGLRWRTSERTSAFVSEDNLPVVAARSVSVTAAVPLVLICFSPYPWLAPSPAHLFAHFVIVINFCRERS